MKSGVNVAIGVDDAIVRLIESTIFPKDIVLLTEQSLRTAQRLIHKARKILGKPPGYKITIREFCEAYPEHDPVRLAYRLTILRRQG